MSPSTTKPYWACPNGACETIIDPRPSKIKGHYHLPYTAAFLEGAGELGGYGPQELQSAYNIPTEGGSTQTVAVIDAFGYEKAESDLAAYRERYGLEPCTKENGCFKKVNEEGKEEKYPPPGPPGEWEVETALDLDMVSAACPQCHILLVQSTHETIANLGKSVNTAAELGATEISNSYGAVETSEECGTTDCTQYNSDYNHPGVVVTVSSGDNGYENQLLGGPLFGPKAPLFPASSSSVTAVGGTALHKFGATGTRGWSEEVWSGSGSGCSRLQVKPSWQTDKGCATRTDNDVAAVAAPETPVSIYNTQLGGWSIVGGTSASSPLLAGIEAHSNVYTRDLGAQAFYLGASSLNKVTVGKNGECPEVEYLCHAEAGYSGPIGNGTPNGPLALTSPVIVANVQPNAGPPGGGTHVVISGTNLAGATAVKFGSTNATSFSVNSEGTMITAVSPAGHGTAEVTVTTPNGIVTGPTPQFSWRPGAALAWGANESGQLGNGGSEKSSVPVEVKGPTEATSVSAGAAFSLARLMNGNVRSWGANEYGQLGDGNTEKTTEPVEVKKLATTGVTAVAAGANFGLALTKEGKVYAWGENKYGQLGVGNTEKTTEPVEVKKLSGVVAIAAGANFALALSSQGKVLAWGANEVGELGDGNTTNATEPVENTHLGTVAAIAGGGNHALALLANGTVDSWGENAEGDLGTGSASGPETCGGTACATTPVAVKELSEATGIAAGAAHSLALLKSGAVKAWGSGLLGELGTGNTTSQSSPVEVPGISEVTAIAAGFHHSLDLLRSGQVLAAGENAAGQLGDGTSTGPETCEVGGSKYACSRKPVPVSGSAGETAVAGGNLHSLAIGGAPIVTNVQTDAGPPGGGTKVTITGAHFTGPAFAGPSEVKFGAAKATSFTVNSSTSITAVSPPQGGQQRTVDVTVATTTAGSSAASPADQFTWRQGSALAWGEDAFGQLGNGSMGGNFSEPVKVKGPRTAVAVAGGVGHSLALLANGTVLASGNNEYGQLGDGTTIRSDVPVPVCKVAEFPCKPENYLAKVVAIAAGGNYSMALLNNGEVVDWGSNISGELGDGTLEGPETCTLVEGRLIFTVPCSRKPVAVNNLSGVTGIATGGGRVGVHEGEHSLALSNHHVYAWGDNSYGQLGNGKAPTASDVPVEAIGISTATAIAAGASHSLALLRDSHVDAWGLDLAGQLGIGVEGAERGVPAHTTVPTEVHKLGGVTAIAAGFQHSLAVVEHGHVMAWGLNGGGQLGIGNQVNADLPQEVCEVDENPCKNHLSGVTGIAGGVEFSTAQLGNGHVVDWGDDRFGQFGTGAHPEPSLVPVEDAVLSEVGGVAAGFNFSVDLLRDGVVKSAGENDFGQLGSGTQGPEICEFSEPGGGGGGTVTSAQLCSRIRVEFLQSQPPLAVAGGEHHSLALLSDGTVLASGANESGQLGDGTTTNRDVAVPVCKVAESPCKWENYLRGVIAVAASARYSMALLGNGHVVDWGENASGQLGDGKTNSEQAYSDVPVEVTGIGTATAITAGAPHSLAVLSNGHVKAWGNNNFGQLGSNSQSSPTPVEVECPAEGKGPCAEGHLSEVTAVAGSLFYSLALLRNGHVEAWGENASGQLGIGTSGGIRTLPVEVHNLSGATAIAAGQFGGVALLGDGHVADWGGNGFGQLGNGTLTPSSLPVEVKEVSEATAIAAGPDDNLALLGNGQVKDWGENSKGQLGDGTTQNRDLPVGVKELTEATSIAGGGYHSLAIGQP